MKWIILLLLFLSGCIQPYQFTADCSQYRDISIAMNCYRERAYYYAAIGDVTGAVSQCDQLNNYLLKIQNIHVSFLAFDKTMADVARVTFVIDNYNNCILNVARLTRDETLCSKMKTPGDIVSVVPALKEMIDLLIPATISSEQMCRIEVRSVAIRDRALRPFTDYIR
ncbi:MAG: hypothetical protein NZ908_01150 [Candidatus Micrarchaeota archaeon]|nr:hypothetical protein [Candidatus Micrarchaeota archaeon]MCX8154500.1 hypothetical protein [Candidatus Micrarchaeota archaeon]